MNINRGVRPQAASPQEVFMDFIYTSIDTFPDWAKLLATGIIAMLPVVELRGSVPIGVMTFGLPPLPVFIASVIGNMVPIPFIILFIRKVFAWLKKKKWIAETVSKLEKRALRGASLVHKYQVIGLFIFVAIPLPGTGAWSGALIAALLDMRLKSAVPAIFCGVVTAGLIMSLASHGAFSFFSLFGG